MTADDRMYRQVFNRNGTTKHSRHCKAAFGRYDWRCHRCAELRRGAAPRPGWHTTRHNESQRRFIW